VDDRQKIIEAFENALKPLTYVHALWLEGSIPQGYADKYSDLDIWISVDDKNFKSIYDDIDKILSSIGKTDLRYVMKHNDELGHIIYHLAGMSEFLTIDVNVQKINRKVSLIEGIDEVNIIFDKNNIVKSRSERPIFEKPSPQRLQDYFQAMHPNVIKNIKRGRPLEAYHYYDGIIEEIIKYFRLQAWHAEKANYWRKHVYRDLKADIVKKLEYFTFIKPEEIGAKLKELGKWINSL
jgi:hypothetical protein